MSSYCCTYVSSCCYMCPHTATYMCPHTAVCVLVLLHMCSHAGILHIRFLIRLYVSSYCYMCPHTVSRYSHLTCHPLSNTHTVGRRGGQEEEQEQGAPYDSRTSPLAIQQVQREGGRERREKRKSERDTHNTKIDVFFFFACRTPSKEAAGKRGKSPSPSRARSRTRLKSPARK